jgi:multimeric flavodoxin WrbA
MNKLFICGSNRNKNCFRILNDLKSNEDELVSLSNKDIKFCLGCNACQNNIKNYCVINDYMQDLYPKIIDAEKIIIASPIYMNHITGILKNVIDRFNPFLCNDALNGKQVYLILTGQMSAEDNKEEIMNIINYFKGISEFMGFSFMFLKYFSSGDVLEIDDVKKNNLGYGKAISEIKAKIN